MLFISKKVQENRLYIPFRNSSGPFEEGFGVWLQNQEALLNTLAIRSLSDRICVARLAGMRRANYSAAMFTDGRCEMEEATEEECGGLFLKFGLWNRIQHGW